MGSGRAEKPGPCGICGGGDRWRGRLLYERLFSMIVKHLRLWIFECREPSHEAFKLGLAAAGLLVLAHVVANLLGGCNCICSQDELQKAPPNKQLSMACLVFTWIILAVGLSMLVIGTWSNHKSRASCGFTHHHFLSIGGILCFVHGLFCVAYYISATASTV
ncbi:protein VASCULATURE COMPLEXITY AND CONNECTIVITY-like [Malus domestica]|uniref:protein VASCULATURE COMPLEXITY AND CONNECTIVITY-like n=1 Tax=Malus domestica TaxID=3750 RepID=UPI00397653EF